MKEIEIKLGFKSKIELFFIMLKIDWQFRKIYGFRPCQVFYDIFIRKHKALIG